MTNYDQNEKDLAEAEAFVSRHPRIVLEGIYIAGLHAERARSAKLVEILEKIADPRKRDHREPDAYTALGCVMHMAEEAIAEYEASRT